MIELNSREKTMRNVMTVVMVLACSTAWGQSDPANALGVSASLMDLVQNGQLTAAVNKAAAIQQRADVAALIGAWNPNVGDHSTIASIVLDDPTADPMLWWSVYWLNSEIENNVTEMWSLCGDAILLNNDARVSYLCGNVEYNAWLYTKANEWYVRSLGQSAGAMAKIHQSMMVRAEIVAQIAELSLLVID